MYREYPLAFLRKMQPHWEKLGQGSNWRNGGVHPALTFRVSGPSNDSMDFYEVLAAAEVLKRRYHLSDQQLKEWRMPSRSSASGNGVLTRERLLVI